MAIIDSPEQFSMGRVFNRVFGALFANLPFFLALAAIALLPMLAFSAYTASDPALRELLSESGAPNLAMFSRSLALLGVTMLISTICLFVLQAALVQGTIVWLNGERPSFGTSLSTALRSLLPVFAIAILSALGVALGMVLLIVPGIVLALMWSVAVPVLIVERTGIGQAFGRSRALTKGYRWQLLILVFAYWVLITLFSVAVRLVGVGVLTVEMSGITLVATVLASWAEQVVFAVISSIGVAVIYYELRLVKEGAGPQQLAQAFD